MQVVRVLDLRAEGLGFDPWLGHGDCVLGPCTFTHAFPFSPKSTNRYWR